MTFDTRIAEQFGNAVVKGDFEVAHSLLTEEAKQKHSPEIMRQDVASMIAYAGEPLKRIHVITDAFANEWPDKQYGDICWVYVSLEGDSYGEGAFIILAETDDGIRIRDIEWGRP